MIRHVLSEHHVYRRGVMETIVRPRLNDFHGILLLQDSVDYVIPFLDEKDIRTYTQSGQGNAFSKNQESVYVYLYISRLKWF